MRTVHTTNLTAQIQSLSSVFRALLRRLSPGLGALLLVACQSGGGAGGGAKADGSVVLLDPKGDDNGPGTYVYPTDQAYNAGAFDLTKFEVVPRGNTVEFRVTVARRILDPWDSKAWNGNGFSVQMAFIHIDTDGKPGSGATEGLPGTNVRFSSENAWDRVVLISPQPQTRVLAEVEEKAPQHKARVVVPSITRAAGKTLTAIVNVEDLGGPPSPSWGYQVLMQSNEGFPDKGDLLTRKVNEYEGQHRFGGGSDYNNDPHVIDMLAGAASGAASEVEQQHTILSGYNKEATEPESTDLAEVPLIYKR